MQLRTKTFIRNSALTFVLSVLVFLYIRSRDIKYNYLISDKKNQKKEITIIEYKQLEKMPDNNKAFFLLKEPVHLYKKALMYSGSFFCISMGILTIVCFRKREE